MAFSHFYYHPRYRKLARKKDQIFGNILTAVLVFSKISCASNFKGPQYTPDFADKYFWIAW
jgi:hypothetical protein